MAINTKNTKQSKKSKFIQPTFAGGAKYIIHCSVCKFQYDKTRNDLVLKHNTIHDDFLYGQKVSKTITNKLLSDDNVVNTFSININGKDFRISVVIIPCTDKQIIQLVTKMLELVNKQWLNSTECSLNWKKRPFDCKVILLLAERGTGKEKNVRIIGITTLDAPPEKSSYLIGYHLSTKTSTIGTEKPALNLRLGVSRIYVNEYYRRHGLAVVMLNAVLKHGIYGIVLNPWQIGFSQPSSAGMLMLEHWYKSVTIPVYHEL
jgi:N-acetyltransferase